MRGLWGLFAAGAVSLAIGASSASAAAITVNSTADPGDGTCNAAECTLREAINEAQSAGFPDADTLTITATGTVALQSVLPAITTEMEIEGPGADQLTITRAMGAPEFRIFTILDLGGDLLLRGVTVAGGVATPGTTPGGGAARGGGILLEFTVVSRFRAHGGPGPALDLQDSVVRDNVARSSTVPAEGGGIFAVEGADVRIHGSTISGNIAEHTGTNGVAHGGGIWTIGPRLEIRRDTISGNLAVASGATSQARGGGIYSAHTGSNPRFESTTFAFNEVRAGGTREGASVYDEPPRSGMHTVPSPQNVIFSNPIGATNCNVGLSSGDHNLDDDGSCGLTDPNDQQNVDPLLYALAPNGHSTPTHAIDATSPAYDKGFSSGVTEDQRGLPIFDDPLTANAGGGGDGKDIGAFEAQSRIVPPGGGGSGSGSGSELPGAPEERRCKEAKPTVKGTSGDDLLIGTDGPDVIKGFKGDDVIRGLGGDDLICGGRGDDKAFGGKGRDTVRGGRHDDSLHGGAGRDFVHGYFGDDLVDGGPARDTCRGGVGNNTRVRCETR